MIWRSVGTKTWIAALALLVPAFQPAAHAGQITFASFFDSQPNQWNYTGGALTANTATATFISFGPLNQLLNYTGPVTYSVTANATSPATNVGGIISQPLAGQMRFKNGPTTVLDVFFVGAILSGTAGSNSTGAQGDTTIAGEIISYTADASVLVGSFVPPYSFSIGLTQIPGINISGSNLANFTATASGTFAADQSGAANPVPEPASLALFGMAGLPLLLRRRRTSR